MGTPSYTFTTREVSLILAREAARLLNADIPDQLKIDLTTTTDDKGQVTKMRVCLRDLRKEG